MVLLLLSLSLTQSGTSHERRSGYHQPTSSNHFPIFFFFSSSPPVQSSPAQPVLIPPPNRRSFSTSLASSNREKLCPSRSSPPSPRYSLSSIQSSTHPPPSPQSPPRLKPPLPPPHLTYTSLTHLHPQSIISPPAISALHRPALPNIPSPSRLLTFLTLPLLLLKRHHHILRRDGPRLRFLRSVSGEVGC